MFSPELKTRAEELIDRYPVGRSALLPLLHLVQAEAGYISDEGVAEVAGMLDLTKAEVAAVATFYTMYKRSPTGRHLVSVCTNFSCKVRGAEEVYRRLRDKLGVGHNETTKDGLFTLEHAECLGNCEGAPVVSVDYLNYECVSAEQAEELIDRVAAGELPPPTRGPIPPGLREVSVRLAGLAFPQKEQDVAGARPYDAHVGQGSNLDRSGQEAAAEQQVRAVGLEPDAVEDQASRGQFREMPTRERAEVGTPDTRVEADVEQQPREGRSEVPAHGGDVPEPEQPRPRLDEETADGE